MILLQLLAAACFAAAAIGLGGAVLVGPASAWLAAAVAAVVCGAMLAALHRGLDLLGDIRDELRQARAASDRDPAPAPEARPLPGGRPMRPVEAIDGTL